jgi:hypothetical protein
MPDEEKVEPQPAPAPEVKLVSGRYKFYGRRVIIKETGTEFVTGETFRPDWYDLRAAIMRLKELGLTEDLVPGVDVEFLLKGNKSETHALIRILLERAAKRDYVNVAPFQVQVCMWVLANYWYCHLGGPKLEVPVFRCPYCYRKWAPPKIAMNQGKVLRAFAVFLTRHSCMHEHESINNSTRHIQTKDES